MHFFIKHKYSTPLENLKKANRNVKNVEILGDGRQTSLMHELHELPETTEYWWPKLRVTIIFCLFSFLGFGYLIILSCRLLEELKMYFYPINGISQMGVKPYKECFNNSYHTIFKLQVSKNL